MRATPIRTAASRWKPAVRPGSIIRTSPASTTSAKSAACATSSLNTSRARTSATWCMPTARSRLADALRYMLQIADALMHAWQRDVVHRDIKPSNILLTPEGQAKLVDMGLARVRDRPIRPNTS